MENLCRDEVYRRFLLMPSRLTEEYPEPRNEYDQKGGLWNGRQDRTMCEFVHVIVEENDFQTFGCSVDDNEGEGEGKEESSI